jgi:hypothetical protein
VSAFFTGGRRVPSLRESERSSKPSRRTGEWPFHVCENETLTLSEFFSSALVTLPIDSFREGEIAFDRFLGEIFQAYTVSLRRLSDPQYPTIWSQIKDLIPEIENLCRSITGALGCYLDGSPSDAYLELEQALSRLSLDRLITPLKGYHSGPPNRYIDNILHPPLYRMRVATGLPNSGVLSRKEMFHVPFELRDRVHNQRYSIAGLPCLYLASSIWLCWEELSRPELHSVFVSRFRIAEEVKVLDFSFPPDIAWTLHLYSTSKTPEGISTEEAATLGERYTESFIVTYLACWPLIAACSVKRSRRGGAFYPQYITPQLLLQWIRKTKKVDGLRYFSTRAQQGTGPYTNCAFPVREIDVTGQCSFLSSKFNLTNPIAWSVLRELQPTPPLTVISPSNRQTAIHVTEDIKYWYPMTGFFQAEEVLRHIEEVELGCKSVDM